MAAADSVLLQEVHSGVAAKFNREFNSHTAKYFVQVSCSDDARLRGVNVAKGPRLDSWLTGVRRKGFK